MASNGGGLRSILKGLAMLAVFGGLVLAARQMGLESRLSGQREWLLAQIVDHGALGVFYFVAGTALASAMGLPRQLPAFLGGYAFGWLWGGVLATLGTSLGCALDFSLARTLGREFVLGRFGHRVAKLNAFLCADPFRTSLAIRLFPVGHNLTTSVAAGVTGIPASAFLIGSALGYLPQNLVFAIFGAGVNAESNLGRVLSLGVSVVLLAGSTWLGMSVYRAYRRKGAVPTLDEAEENGSGDEG
jgi:uncharacterized membrane protein YdjX (TVP38/TMEM64 family)